MATETPQIVAKDGWRYSLTATDLYWAERMAAFEGGSDPAEVLWTMAQAFSLHRRGTFAAFIRAYSQPINPKWLRMGSCCCGAGGGRCPRAPRCAEPECSTELTARRQSHQTISTSALERSHPRAVARAREWARAQVTNAVPGAVEFANARVSTSFLNRTSGSKVIKKAGNWFISTRRSVAADTGALKIAYGGKTAGAGAGGAGAVMTLGAMALAYALWRRRGS